MTLEHTIQAMFDQYPLLFQTRADCLNQLFCTLGNGYKWQNGELISFEETEPVNDLVDGRAHQYQILTRRSAAIICAEANNKPIDEHIMALPETPYEETRRPRKERWYFVHRLGRDKPTIIELYKERTPLGTVPVPLWNIPADIKPDWLAGIKECKAMLLEDGIIGPEDMPCETM